MERSGTGWDELYYDKIPTMKEALKDKKVAVFGLGDQESYAENFADATGELFDVFEGLGCKMLGAWSMEGYEHEDSKSIRGDKFCGLLLDVVNQEELTEGRAKQWVEQLKSEGILEGASAAAVSPAPVASAAAPDPVVAEVEKESLKLKQDLEDSSALLDQNIASQASGGFTAHRNAKTGKTMWTSPDGRSSYVTTE